MAAVAQALPLLTKAGMYLKGLIGSGSIGKLATNPQALAAFSRGDKLRGALGNMGSTMAGRLGPIGFGSKEAVTNTALMFGPDAAFGVLSGAMTPGDLGDKVIAGGMTAAGGALGGAGLRTMYGGKNAAIQMGLELGGGVGGDMLGQGIADNLLRIKGGGSTPYEKMAADQQRELEEQILRRVLSGKGGYPATNDNTGLY